MTPHESLKQRTTELEEAFYGLLRVCDDYRDTVRALIQAEESGDRRPQLIHRMKQLSGRADQLTRILEDDALTVLLPMIDRLFAVERAERGEDI